MKRTKLLLLLLTLLVATALVLAACGGGATEEPAAEEPAAEEPVAEEPAEEEEAGEGIVAEEATPTAVVMEEVSAYGESPMMAEMVAAGDLPPVEERLPVEADIAVVAGVDGIGEYGGTWHNVSNAQDVGSIKMGLYEPPVRWKADYAGYENGLLTDYVISEDGKSLTWNFREGIKWSDGVPFTMEDMKFWWEDLATNEDVKFITVPWWGFKSDGETMDVTFPDDYTMIMEWDEPHYISTFIPAQGFWEWEPMMRPKHFLSPFHPNYTDGATYEDLELNSINGYTTVEGYPCLMAWCVDTVIPAERTTFARNPYYWKVDTAGNQLPYIDQLDITIITDDEVRMLETSQGKFEATFRGARDPNYLSFLFEQAEAGDYQLMPGAVNGAGSWPGWLINQNFNDSETYPDTWEEIGDLLRDKNFRQGVSHAMDRQRLVDVVWGGIGYPTQATISPQAWHFASAEGQAVYEAWRDSHIEYDVAFAEELLDAANFTDQDGDGWRDLPSGAPFTLVLDQGDWGGKEVSANSNESFKADLEAVGIQVLINDLVGQPDWDLRQTTAKYMFRNAHVSELDIWTYPDWIFPLRDNRAFPMEGKWRQTGGEEGWEPQPGSPAYELQALYDKGLATATIEDRHKVVWEAVQILIDEGPFTLGGAGDQQVPVVVRNGFMGIPDLVILGPWAPASPGNLHPEQFWMQADLRAESLGE